MSTRGSDEETGLKEQGTAATHCLSVVTRLLETIARNEEGTRRGEDSEALHDMRVATRRMRAALRVFKDALPPELTRLRDEYEWLGGVLGEVRDLDVQIDSLQAPTGVPEESRGGLEEVIAATKRRREGCRALLLDALDSERYQALLEQTRDGLEAPATSDGEGPLAPFAALAIRRAHRRFRRAADALASDAPNTAFHETRKKARYLRYTVEFVLPAFEPAANKLIRALVELQDLLGEHQDRVASSELLRDIALENANAMSAQALVLVGRLIQDKEAGLTGLRKQVPSGLRRIRKRWRRMRDVMG